MPNYVPMIPAPRWQDILDVLIVAYVIYRIAMLIRGTRTVQMIVGLVIVGAAFVISQVLGLFTLNWLLNNFLGSLIVILVVIFQPDIRRALSGVGARSLFTAGPRKSPPRSRGWRRAESVHSSSSSRMMVSMTSSKAGDWCTARSRPNCSRPSSCAVRRSTTAQ